MSRLPHPWRTLLRVAGLVCGLAAVLLLAPAARAASCPENQSVPLQFGDNVTNLPAGVVDRPYAYTLRATGGTPPYAFHAESLPPGMSLSAAGRLTGTPHALPSIALFTASVRDHLGCTVDRQFRVAIVAPRQPAAKPSPAPSPVPKPAPPPAPPKPLQTMTPEEILAKPPANRPGMDTYVLTGAIFKDKAVLAELKQMSVTVAPATSTTPAYDPTVVEVDAPAEAGTAAGDTVAADDAAQDDDAPLYVDTQAQFKRLLEPLIGVEYPGRDLFAAALDTRLCRFSASLVAAAARKQGLPLPNEDASHCPPDWDATAQDDSDDAQNGKVAWQRVPLALMSPAMRSLLIDKARENHPLDGPAPPAWDGSGCGCVGRLSGKIYGFYPFWRTGATPQRLDFSLLSRISLFALWYHGNGDLVVPDWDTPQQTAFVLTAHRHRTQLDYTLYRNDWQFLKKEPGAEEAQATVRLAEQAADLIDTPVPGLVARSHAMLPGFAEVERMGDGLSFFPDKVPAAGSPLRAPFERYVDAQIRALIAELRHRQRHYVLNIVLRDSDLLAKDGAWQVGRLYDYVREAEAPDMQDDHIVVGSARYRSNTNLTLHYLVLLTDPTVRSKRDLRAAVYQDHSLNEDDRRVLLRKLIPVVSSGDVSSGEVADQLAYFSDNFGGVGFWAAPDQSLPSGRTISGRIRASFLASVPEAERFDAWVCTRRWPLRMAFEGLLLLWLVAFALYRTNCRFRNLPYQLGLLAGAIGVVLLGALLLAGDPGLEALREGNALLGLLLFALIATIAYHILKPRVEKP
ncbi:putative Ig domain-containing protein [Fulvimonas sp. R45]|uniref:putative Ig domain-containing protein n=1 Tax=Fulvimonas sp. R45 TaxID=3045937 RepID=UPI00265F9A71|nr:putative Ig domain-containing protein [Fulvimonas sp. R45]MDO1529055.1 putative Ig domain-containing protein [Fulvimonas sp. R45]